MRPAGPDPATARRSIPVLRARALTAGEASGLSPSARAALAVPDAIVFPDDAPFNAGAGVDAGSAFAQPVLALWFRLVE